VGEDELVTLRLPSKSSFHDLPRVGLAALLRIHRIDPGGLAYLASSVRQATGEMLAGGGDIEINYRVTETEIQVEIRAAGQTTRISGPRHQSS
jgi:hypothetical protein